jgi:plastocyanin
MRPSCAFSVALAAITLAACGSSGGTEPAPVNTGGGGGGGGNTANVTVSNNSYSPNQASVAAGGTVTWRWDSCTGDGYGGQVCAFHSVTFDDGGPSASPKNDGSFARTFASPGTFTYYCTSHGRGAMSGSVIVQ